MDNQYQVRSGYLWPERVNFSRNTVFVSLCGNLDRAFVSGLHRTSTFSPSWIYKFPVSVLTRMSAMSHRRWRIYGWEWGTSIQDAEDAYVLRSLDLDQVVLLWPCLTARSGLKYMVLAPIFRSLTPPHCALISVSISWQIKWLISKQSFRLIRVAYMGSSINIFTNLKILN